MAVTDFLRRSYKAPTLDEKAPLIQSRIEEAEARQRSLQGQFPAAALDVELDAPGAGDRLAALKSDLAEVDSRLEQLRAAHQQALAEDQRQMAQHRAHTHAVALQRLKRKLDLRDAEAAKMTAALATAVEHFQAMIKAADEASFAGRAFGNLPTDAQCGHRQLVDLVKRELVRVGCPWPVTTENRLVPDFPGQLSRVLTNPGSLEPIADALARATEHTINTLTGKEPIADIMAKATELTGKEAE